MAISAPASVPKGVPGAKAPGFERTGVGTIALFLVPAAILLLVFLVYPTVQTVLLSFNRGLGGNLTRWVGFANYQHLFGDANFVGSIINNVLWIVFYTGFVLMLGLIVAVIAMRVRYEAIIKAVVFLPMAISATALAVIWGFVYYSDPDIGLLNALLAAFHGPAVSWLGDPGVVNAALITVGVWGSTGFATVILSAALKGIPTEILEAARIDGANEFQIFRRIILPMVSLPMSVLAVTLIVNVIKLFDIPYVMTHGGPGTSSRVIAFQMYIEGFGAGQWGRAAAVAVVMLLVLIPVMVFNVRRFRSEAVV